MSACSLPQVNVLEACVHQVLRGALVDVALGLNLVIVGQTVHLRQVTIIIRPKKIILCFGQRSLKTLGRVGSVIFFIFFYIKN